MTEKSKLVRPSQVTMSGWLALVGSLLLVVTLFDSVSRLQSVESRESIAEFLSSQPGSGLGLDIAQLVEFLRVLMLVSGAAAAAAAVLAIYVLQRHKAARVGLTVAAAALVLTLATAAAIPDAPVSGGFLPVMIAFAAITLWTKPARDWFDGVPASEANSSRTGSQSGTFGGQTPRYGLEGNLLSSENQPPNEQPEGPGAGGGRPTSGDETAPWPRMPDDTTGRPLPPPTQGFGSQPGQGGQAGQSYPPGGYPPAYGQQQPYGQQPYGQQPYGGYPQQYGQPYYGAPQPPRDPEKRPTTVAVAAWVTWALSGLTLLGLILTGLALAVGGEDVVRQVEQDPNVQSQLDGYTIDQLIAAVWVFVAIGAFWSLAAIVLAFFAYRRANWARITLVVSSAVTALFSLLTFPVGLLHTFGSGAVIALLFLGGANEWYARRTGVQAFPGAFQPYGQPQQPPQQQYGAAPPPYPGQPQQDSQEPSRGRGKDEPPSNVW